MIPPRGCAYVCFNTREAAAKAKDSMKYVRLLTSILKVCSPLARLLICVCMFVVLYILDVVCSVNINKLQKGAIPWFYCSSECISLEGWFAWQYLCYMQILLNVIWLPCSRARTCLPRHQSRTVTGAWEQFWPDGCRTVTLTTDDT